MSHALIFNGVTLSPITHQNSLWIRSAELASALGYGRENQVSRLYRSNADEFTPDMTQLIEISAEHQNGVLGSAGRCRIFSLRGCHLVAMFSRTKVAKDFRKWVLNVLDSLTTAERRPLADELLLPPAPSSVEADAAVARHIFAAIDAAERCAPRKGRGYRAGMVRDVVPHDDGPAARARIGPRHGSRIFCRMLPP